jgi:hypothetical protein
MKNPTQIPEVPDFFLINKQEIMTPSPIIHCVKRLDKRLKMGTQEAVEKRSQS